MNSRSNQTTHLWDYPWVRDLALIIGGVIVLWLVYTIRSVTAPILIGLGFAYIFNPMVTLVHRKLRWPRWVTTSLILLWAYVVLASVLLWVIPPTISQTVQLSSTVSHFAIKHADTLEPYWQMIAQQASDDPSQTVTSLADSLQDMDLNYGALGKVLLRTLNIGMGAIGSAFNMAMYLGLVAVIISFCFFFFSWKFGPILAWFDPLIPLDVRERSLTMLREMDRATHAFIRGRLIQAAVMGILLSLGWWMVDVRFWLLLGLICGILNLIPYAAVIGCAAAVALSCMYGVGEEQSFDWGLILWPSAVYVAVQLIDGWVVEPIVQGKATNLDPLSVLLAVMIGGALMGLLGMLLAIPLASCLKILGTQWIVPQLKDYAQSRPPETPPEVSSENSTRE